MVRSGESLNVEFKVRLPKLERLAKSFSAFSNSSGGTIFFGVDDDGVVQGLENPGGTKEFVETVAQFHCDPPVVPTIENWEPIRGQFVLVVTIPESDQKPVHAINPKNEKDSWPFFRSDKENLPLDKQSLRTMRAKTAIEINPDELEELDRHSMNILNKLQEKPRQTIGQLAKSTNISTHRAKKIMVNLERKGWIHSFFNEKRREYSLAVPWKRK